LSSRFSPSRLKKIAHFAPLLALIAVFTLSTVTVAHAQAQNTWTETGWVSSATVQDLTGNSALVNGQALLAGHSYNLTLQIVVPNTSISTKTFQVSLNNRLGPSTAGQSVDWVVHNPSYVGYNRTLFNGGDPTVSFEYMQGTVRVSAYFEIPQNFTIPVAKYSSASGNGTITLHFPQQNVVLASVVPFGSTGTGAFAATVEDQDIQAYNNAASQSSSLIPSGQIPSTYSSLVNSILSQASALNKLGLPTNGTALLGVITPSAFPKPPSSSLQTDLLAGLGASVVLVIVLLVVAIRSRGKSGYASGVINDVQKDLAVLEVTAAKYDRSMADKLKALRDKLSESR
jgi:hypothetical protein